MLQEAPSASGLGAHARGEIVAGMTAIRGGAGAGAQRDEGAESEEAGLIMPAARVGFPGSDARQVGEDAGGKSVHRLLVLPEFRDAVDEELAEHLVAGEIRRQHLAQAVERKQLPLKHHLAQGVQGIDHRSGSR